MESRVAVANFKWAESGYLAVKTRATTSHHLIILRSCKSTWPHPRQDRDRHGDPRFQRSSSTANDLGGVAESVWALDSDPSKSHRAAGHLYGKLPDEDDGFPKRPWTPPPASKSRSGLSPDRFKAINSRLQQLTPPRATGDIRPGTFTDHAGVGPLARPSSEVAQSYVDWMR